MTEAKHARNEHDTTAGHAGACSAHAHDEAALRADGATPACDGAPDGRAEQTGGHACGHDHDRDGSHAHGRGPEQGHEHEHGHNHACDHDHEHGGAHAHAGADCCTPAALTLAPLPTTQATASGNVVSSFRIMQMDCPTEETLIRKKLGGMREVAALEFNLMQRMLTVEHVPSQ